MCGRTCVRPLVAKHLRTGMSATGWTRYNFEYDRLRGSASTVLTATGQVNGRWQILTPQNQNPRADCDKIQHN